MNSTIIASLLVLALYGGLTVWLCWFLKLPVLCDAAHPPKPDEHLLTGQIRLLDFRGR
ncbi:MAG: hypothetical protein JXA73_20390 [Acidobacteria bacterium]|nr:hypothetical protein [Acidobacteriota bacterium]